MGERRDESVSGHEGPAVVRCAAPPRWHAVRQRFLDLLGLKINDEQHKSFVKLRT
jgi:hypothetical protein